MVRIFRGRARQPLGPGGLNDVLNTSGGLTRDIFVAVGAATQRGGSLTMIEAIRQLSVFLGTVQPERGSRLDDETVVRQMASRRALETTRMAQQTAAAMSSDAAVRLKSKLLQMDVSLATYGDAIDVVGDFHDAEWWRVERAVKTEASRVYNAARTDAIIDLAHDHPGMLKRWTELVDDATGMPMDKRVGVDSIVLHGQVAAPLAMFTFPPDSRVPKMVGMSWVQPPNRPQDRAVLLPWLPSFGMPAWKYVAGQRITMPQE